MPDTPVTTPVTHHGRDQDPTALTTQQLQRELALFRQIIETQIAAVRGEINMRLDGMDKAIALVQQYPTAVDRAIHELRQLHEEKFNSLRDVLSERKMANAAQLEANRAAIDKAFAAANELVTEQRRAADAAVNKSEISFSKQLEQITTLFNASSANLSQGIADLKERVGGVENRAKGAAALWGFIVGGIGLLAVLIAIFFSLGNNLNP